MLPGLGEEELNQLTSWKNISREITSVKYAFQQLSRAAKSAAAIHAATDEAKKGKGYSSFMTGIERAKGTISGTAGQQLDIAINKFVTKVRSMGGVKINAADLTKAIGELRTQVSSASGSASGINKQLLDDIGKKLTEAVGKAQSGGIGSLGGVGSGIGSIGFALQDKRKVEQASTELAAAMKTAADNSTDPSYKRALNKIRDDFISASDAAKTTADKLAVLGSQSVKLEWLWGSGRGTSRDKATALSLSGKAETSHKEIKKDLALQRTNRIMGKVGGFLKEGAGKVGAAMRYLGPLKAGFDASNNLFQQINSTFNRVARTQMAISAERGGYGRQIRGAGINFRDMMGAIGAGRSAGMLDNQVVGQMVSLQEQLARARWGEGSLIENLGKWGLSPFDANGNMKSNNEVMIDISRKLNSMTDNSEKLQFLNMQGFKPEQMEYVANYEKHARRMEALKANPSMAGILEQADILDQNGMSARIDAATKIEQRRRQILNQNAWDKGIIPGVLRSMAPENWAFSDWTARQRGLATAKSEVAIGKLNNELENVRRAVVENKGALKGNTYGLTRLSAKTLENLSLTSGKAEADIRDKGENSGYYQLRKIYAAQTGTIDLNKVRANDRREAIAKGGVIGAGGGFAAGAAGGALAGAALTSWSGPGALVGAAIGAIVGAITGLITGAASGHSIGPGATSNYGMDDHIKILQKLRKKKDRAGIEKHIRDYDLGELDWEVVASKRFKNTEKAREILTGAWVAKNLVGAQSLTSQKVDVEAAIQNFASDKYYKSDRRAAQLIGKEVSKAQLHGAFARAGSGDKRAGVDAQTAANYVRYGFDVSDQETKAIIAREQARLAKEKENKDKTTNELHTQATKNARKQWIHSLTAEDIRAAREQEAKKPELVEEEKKRAAAEWDDIVSGGEFVRARGRVLTGAGEDMVQNVISGETATFSKDYENVIDRLKELNSKTKLSSEEEAEKSWLERLSTLSGYGTKESYVAMRARKAQASGTSQLEEIEQELQGTSTLWESYDDKTKAQKFQEYRDQHKGDNLEGLIKRYSLMSGASEEDLRKSLVYGKQSGTFWYKGDGKKSLLYSGLTEEEQAAVDRSDFVREKFAKHEADYEKSKQNESDHYIARDAKDEDIRAALGEDEGEIQFYKKLNERAGVWGSQRISDDKEREWFEERRSKVAQYLRDKKENEEDEAYTREEEAEDEENIDAVLSRGAEAAGVESSSRWSGAEMSDFRRMYDLQKRGGITEDELARRFTPERLEQYKEAVASGEVGEGEIAGEDNKPLSAREEYKKKLEKKYAKARIFGDDQENDEWKQEMIKRGMEAYDERESVQAAQQSALDDYLPNRKKKKNNTEPGKEVEENQLLPGYSLKGEGEASAAMKESADKTTQAVTAGANATQKAEAAAASGMAKMSEGGSKVEHKETITATVNMHAEFQGLRTLVGSDESSATGSVKKYGDDLASRICDVFCSVTKKDGII